MIWVPEFLFTRGIYHIWIIPVPGSGVGCYQILIISIVVYNVFNRSPRILNIVKVPPEVTMRLNSREIGLDTRIDLINRPAARVDHCLSSAIQKSAELRISSIHVIGQGIAAIQFHIIHIPFGKLKRICFLIANNAGITSACEVSIVLINAEFQASRMNLKILKI